MWEAPGQLVFKDRGAILDLRGRSGRRDLPFNCHSSRLAMLIYPIRAT
jgi:hypothetical protein